MQVKFSKLHHDAKVPTYATAGSACFDFYALRMIECLTVHKTAKYGTGIAVEVPEGQVMLIFSRSGHGFKDGIRMSNCVGVIDSDYRGEIAVKLKGDDWTQPSFYPGDRIAQGMIIPVERVEFVEGELSDTERGAGGFGSTGK